MKTNIVAACGLLMVLFFTAIQASPADPPLTLVVSVTNTRCSADCYNSGMIRVTGTGGTPWTSQDPYLFSMVKLGEPCTCPCPAPSKYPDGFAYLCEGSYFVTIRDSVGNMASDTVTVNSYPAPPGAGVHVPGKTQITWKWSTVSCASGYKWNTTNDPATAIDLGMATTMTETGLLCSTLYTRFIWSYNPFGISSSATIAQSTTSCFFNCGDPIIDLRDSAVYSTVLIDTLCWMAQNLNAGILITGMRDQVDDGVAEKYCYNDQDSNCLVYGGLYQWDEAMGYAVPDSADPGDRQGICPDMWHLPDEAGWLQLVAFLGGVDTAGGALKEPGTGHWAVPNLGATNSSGFTALPGGSSETGGIFSHFGYQANFWSASGNPATQSWYLGLDHNSTMAHVSLQNGKHGHSIRCVRDSCRSYTAPNVTIVASQNPVNEGTPVTFSAQPVNGGKNPRYRWYVNGLRTSTSTRFFTYVPADADVVLCRLTADGPCLVRNPATSNHIIMMVLPDSLDYLPGCENFNDGESHFVTYTNDGGYVSNTTYNQSYTAPGSEGYPGDKSMLVQDESGGTFTYNMVDFNGNYMMFQIASIGWDMMVVNNETESYHPSILVFRDFDPTIPRSSTNPKYMAEFTSNTLVLNNVWERTLAPVAPANGNQPPVSPNGSWMWLNNSTNLPWNEFISNIDGIMFRIDITAWGSPDETIRYDSICLVQSCADTCLVTVQSDPAGIPVTYHSVPITPPTGSPNTPYVLHYCTSVLYQQQVTLEAPMISGSKLFTRWELNGTLFSTQLSITVMIDSACPKIFKAVYHDIPVACENFDDGTSNFIMYNNNGVTVTNTTNHLSYPAPGSGGYTGDTCMLVHDISGGTFIYDTVDYKGNYMLCRNNMLCWDMRVDNNLAPSYYPSILFFRDFNPTIPRSGTNPLFMAEFTSNYLTPNLEWEHTCAPVNSSPNGILPPQSPDGVWTWLNNIPGITWDEFISDIDGIMYRIDLTSWSGSEDIRYDSICLSQCCENCTMNLQSDPPGIPIAYQSPSLIPPTGTLNTPYSVQFCPFYTPWPQLQLEAPVISGSMYFAEWELNGAFYSNQHNITTIIDTNTVCPGTFKAVYLNLPPGCETFDDSTSNFITHINKEGVITNTTSNLVIRNPGSGGYAGDLSLEITHIADSGVSWLYNAVDFGGNYLESQATCLCWDMIRDQSQLSYYPFIQLYRGFNPNLPLSFYSPQNPQYVARYTSNVQLPVSAWQRTCAYFKPTPGLLPSSADGTWRWISNPDNISWSDFLSDIDGIMFRERLTTWNGTSIFRMDSICFDSCAFNPPVMLPVSGQVGTGEVYCFDATDTVVVAGDTSYFEVLPGGSATFIAGQQIQYLSGTKVHTGAYMHGYISNILCGSSPSAPVVISGQQQVQQEYDFTGFTLYPNPTTGNFTIIQKGWKKHQSVKVEVFGMRGDKRMHLNMTGVRTHEFRFSGSPNGLYFVKVTADGYMQVIKLVKTE